MSPRFVLFVAFSVLGCSCARDAAPPSAPIERASAPAPAPATPSAAPAPPEAPPPVKAMAPPYDLAADLDAKKQLAKEELGAKTDTEVIEQVFLVAAPGGRSALSGALDVTRRSLAAYFNNRFAKRPERVVSVYLFPTAGPYNAYCKKRWEKNCSSPYGFYLASERKIIMNVGPGIGTLTHELVHPLVESDFPQAPDWINEGIASLFEQFHLPRAGEIRGGKNWRLPRLMAALGSKREQEHASLNALFGMSDDVFRGDREDLNYATARYFCQWLDGQNLLWPFYQRWRDDFERDPTGEKSFTAVVGKSVEQADVEWKRWVRQL